MAHENILRTSCMLYKNILNDDAKMRQVFTKYDPQSGNLEDRGTAKYTYIIYGILSLLSTQFPR